MHHVETADELPLEELKHMKKSASLPELPPPNVWWIPSSRFWKLYKIIKKQKKARNSLGIAGLFNFHSAIHHYPAQLQPDSIRIS